MHKQKVILFDIDGTLLDTSVGIVNSVKYAVKKMGLSPIAEDQIMEFIGPPPLEKYMELFGLNKENAKKATKFHREYSEERAIYESCVYEGICDLLNVLKNRGYRLGVATLKKQKVAEKILQYHGIDYYFDAICGMDEKEESTKRDIIQKAISLIESSNAIMVGDSQYDYDGAVEAEIGFVGVTYGFGLKRGNDYSFLVIDSPMEFLKIDCENM